MADHDLQSVAFPTLDDAQIAELGRCTAPRCNRTGMGKRCSRSASATSSSSSSSRARSRSSTTPATRRRRSRSIARASSPATCRTLTGAPVGRQRRRPGRCEVYEVSGDALRQILNQCPDLGDIILQAFIARRQLLRESPDFTGLRVIGSRYSQDTFRVRDFLAKNRVPFTWLDLEADPQVERAAQAVRGDRGRHAGGRLGPHAAPAQSLEPRAGGGARPPPAAGADGVRPGRGRGRAGGAGRRGLRRLRRAEHGGAGAHGARRPGRPQHADRELPRLPHRHHRQRAGRPRRRCRPTSSARACPSPRRSPA